MDFKAWLKNRELAKESASTTGRAFTKTMKSGELKKRIQDAYDAFNSLEANLLAVKSASIPYFHLSEQAKSVLRKIDDVNFTISYMLEEAKRNPLEYVDEINDIIADGESFEKQKSDCEKLVSKAQKLQDKVDLLKRPGTEMNDETELIGLLDELIDGCREVSHADNDDAKLQLQEALKGLKKYVVNLQNFA